MQTRRHLLTRISATAALSGLFGALGVGYATAVEPSSIRLTRRTVAPAGWPAGRSLRIAVVSDPHANVHNIDARDLRGVVDTVNGLSPDLTVLLGDYCSQDSGALTPEEVTGILSGLRAPYGVHAILGNHDWTDARAALKRGHGPTRTELALRAAGLPLLENRAVPLGGGEVWLAGIESEATPWQRMTDAVRTGVVREALRDVPPDAAVILLAHEPDVFALDIDPRVRLVLSGHTHGGQVRVLGWSPWIPSRYGNRYAYGHVRERGRDLVVSGGLGSHFVLGRPVRVGVPPEIVLVDVPAPVASA